MTKLVHNTRSSFFSQNQEKEVAPLGLEKQVEFDVPKDINDASNKGPKQHATSKATATANATFTPSGNDSTVDADVDIDL